MTAAVFNSARENSHALADAPQPPAAAADVPAPPREAESPLQSLVRQIADHPWEFDFFQILRRIENLTPDRPRIGHSRRLADDYVRFGQKPSLSFAPATLSGCVPGEAGAPPRLYVQFMGLCGPWGPMPLHITEYLRERELHFADPTPARFFDIFNHRMIALFYRAWAVTRQTVSFERKGADFTGNLTRGYSDRISAFVASLCGRGAEAFVHRDTVPDLAKLFYTGRLSNQARNAEGLAAILQDFFGMPAQVEEFAGEWIPLPAQAACRLGESPENGTLGVSTMVGSSVWSCQHAFRLRLGPMSFEKYQQMLPGGSSLRRVADWVRNYVGDELSWSLQLVLLAAEVPRVQLGTQGRLGWSTWLMTRPAESDRDDLKLRVAAA